MTPYDYEEESWDHETCDCFCHQLGQEPNVNELGVCCECHEIMTPEGPADMMLSELLDTRGDPWGDADL